MTATAHPLYEALTCPLCGQQHLGLCPRISAIEFWPPPYGWVRRLELRPQTATGPIVVPQLQWGTPQ